MQPEQTRVFLWRGDTDTQQEEVAPIAECRPLPGRELMRVRLPYSQCVKMRVCVKFMWGLHCKAFLRESQCVLFWFLRA